MKIAAFFLLLCGIAATVHAQGNQWSWGSGVPSTQNRPQPGDRPQTRPQPGGGPQNRPQPGGGPQNRPQPGGGPQNRPQPGGGPQNRPQPGGGPQTRPQPGGGPQNRPQPGGGPQNRPQPGGGPQNRPQPGGRPQTVPAPAPAPATQGQIDRNGQLIGCPCVSTHETNLVCATDGNTYGNMGKLRCAQRCKAGVELVELNHLGTCAIANPAPIIPTQ